MIVGAKDQTYIEDRPGRPIFLGFGGRLPIVRTLSQIFPRKISSISIIDFRSVHVRAETVLRSSAILSKLNPRHRGEDFEVSWDLDNTVVGFTNLQSQIHPP